jgi:hypothetical protein
MTHGAAFWFHCVVAVARRPRLWFPAIRQFLRAVPSRWWNRPPFLPLPDRAYLRFRFETAYGARGAPRVADVVRYLEWCRTADAACARIRRDAPPGAGTISAHGR